MNTKNIKKYFTSTTIGLILLFGVSTVVFAGTFYRNTATPPTNNVDTPVDVGIAQLQKTGSLGVGQSRLFKNDYNGVFQALQGAGFTGEVYFNRGNDGDVHNKQRAMLVGPDTDGVLLFGTTPSGKVGIRATGYIAAKRIQSDTLKNNEMKRVCADSKGTLVLCGFATNGSCGSATTAPSVTAPTTNLCSFGTASTVTRNGSSWTWDCAGSNGGTTASCSATVATQCTPATYTNLAPGAQSIAFDPITESVWVGSRMSAVISKMNVKTGAKTDYSLTGTAVNSIIFDSVTNSIWAANYKQPATDTIAKINVNTGAKTYYPLTKSTSFFGAVFDPITESVWVTNAGTTGSVSKIDIRTGSKVDYPVMPWPAGIAFDPSTESVWVTNAVPFTPSATSTMSKINIRNGAKTDYVQTGAKSWGAGYDPVTQSVWVINQLQGNVSKVNTVNGTSTNYATGGNPYGGIVFEPITNSMWISNSTSNTVSKVNVATGAKVDYPLPANPQGVAFDPATKSIWVTSHPMNDPARIYASTLTKICIQ